ncbi:MAG: PglZ domain-containing protein [Chitinophagales bacterium]|nr:PglZ domain-containing protein [Chitinophagales bacterium]
MANEPTILWVDDEIELLKPQILFLKQKGYNIIEASNGIDALEKCKREIIDIVFLDEQMPGRSGLETLTDIKAIQPSVPVVMITKSEEENLMEEAIGSQISDYLIKPVKPQQILLTLKKLLDNRRLVSEKTTSLYQQEFQQIFARLSNGLNQEEWADVYRKLIYWELELDNAKTDSMRDVLAMQKSEANTEFSKFIIKNYKQWLTRHDDNTPTMSHNVLKTKVFPYLEPGTPTFLLLIDNLRFDQWKVIHPTISESFRVIDEDYFYSILPTSTQYSRNAIFAGMMPLEIEKRFPNFWLNDEEEGGKNLHESDFLADQLVRLKKDVKFSYTKITNLVDGKSFADNIYNMMGNDLNVIVYNFVDMLSHARTEMNVIKELADDETAYRSITQSWFQHSPLHDALLKIASKKVNLIILTDHGTIRVKEPVKVIGDRETSTNLRYKHGRNLNYNPKDVLESRNPNELMLPKPHISSSFIFAREDKYFVYPNNYNYHVNLYRNTFQHGGISLEEMIIPVIRLSNK